MRKFSFLLVILISILIGGCTSMQSEKFITPKAEKYPNKPITLIVPYSPGGGLDLVARALVNTSYKYLEQPLVIVNRPGGGGAFGWNELAGSNPDGYTIGMTVNDILLPTLNQSNKYDFPTAIEPIVQVTALPFVMAVKAEQPWQTLNDLVEYAKKHPRQLKFGHAGIGSHTHVIGEMFARNAGITLEQVPFRGASESTSALLGGHIQIIFATPGAINQYVENGVLRVLAVSGNQRLTDSAWTNVPTFEEQGFDIVFNNRYGVAAPKEVPDDIKNSLAEKFEEIIADPEFKSIMENMGMQVKYLGPEETETNWLNDTRSLYKDVQETGILDLINSQKQ